MAEAARREGEHPPFRGQRFLLVLSIILIVVAAFIVWPYRTPIVLSLVIGYATWPANAWLKARVHSKALAGALMLLLVALVIVVPFVAVGTVLVQEFRDLGDVLRDPAALRARFESELTEFGVPADVAENVVPRVTSELGRSFQNLVLPALTAVTDVLVAVIVFFVLLYFVFTDGPDLVDYLGHVMPLDETRTARLFARTGERMNAILYGTLLVGLIQGVFSAIGWWVFGYPAPVLWGFIMTVLAVIPFLGPFLVIIPAGIFGIVQGDLFSGIGLLVWGIGLGGLVDDVVRPYFIGKKSGVHPAVVLIGILGGFAVFGLMGFLLGPLLLGLLGPVLDAWAHPDEEPLAEPVGAARRDQSG